MNHAPSIPTFDRNLFVDREEELKCVEDKIRNYLAPHHPPPRLRHTAFLGPRGCGKSWLLRYLAENHLPNQFDGRILIVFHPLDPATPDLLFHLLTHTAESLELPLPAGATLEEIAFWLPQRCADIDRPVVFIVDEVDRLDHSLLKEVERNYILPLAELHNTFLVLGMRVLAPKGCLRDPVFKVSLDDRYLPTFDAKQTEEQATKLGARVPPGILKGTGGNPLANVVLMKGGTIQECAELMLEVVDASLRVYFWPLAVPDLIEINLMPSLLAAYWGGTPEAWDRQTCHRILLDMTSTCLLHWKSGLAYRMDEALQRVLRQALQEAKPEKWKAIVSILEHPGSAGGRDE